jgi:hypothetical protein
MFETTTGNAARRVKGPRSLLNWTLRGWAVTAIVFGVQHGAKYRSRHAGHSHAWSTDEIATPTDREQ